MPTFIDEGAANARRQSGDDAAIRGAILIVAALNAVDPEAEEIRDMPLVMIAKILLRLLEYVKTVFPDDESVQTASLDLKGDEDTPEFVLIDSEIFFDELIRLPSFNHLPDDAALDLEYLNYVISGGYSCIRQATVGATEDLELLDFPSDEEFQELMLLFAFDDLKVLVPAMSWAFSSELHFGVSSDGTFPAMTHMNVIELFRDKLGSDANQMSENDTRVKHLKLRLSHEFALMAAVCRAAWTVFLNVDETASYDREESILAEGINQALVPATRVIAAEHLSYIRNRMARRSLQQDATLANYAEACRLAHFAFNVSGRARYAKYIAQNLLEIGTITRDDSCRLLAEMIWVDAYAVPFVLGLTGDGNTPFTELGWLDPIYAPHDIAIDYSMIPPYSVKPDFVYSGSVAERLQIIAPSFTPDLWTAAVLLVQHLKDFGELHLFPDPDKKLALFVPTDDDRGRFPMREQHPVAWLYFLSDMLMREHQSQRKIHAGLHFALPAHYEYRRWLGGKLHMNFRNSPSQVSLPSAPRTFPNVAKYLLEPVGKDSLAIGNQSTIWSMVAAKWGA
ncbi:hypothetical protein [Acidithrix sp. C25]|uniref:hypothetical protein n=1 Tax=Acidithrix sp. C25 TaxID=1671482 RepID=UPI00191BAF12|nr:hypothetical protein [Acidithrix sp. C25]